MKKREPQQLYPVLMGELDPNVPNEKAYIDHGYTIRVEQHDGDQCHFRTHREAERFCLDHALKPVSNEEMAMMKKALAE